MTMEKRRGAALAINYAIAIVMACLALVALWATQGSARSHATPPAPVTLDTLWRGQAHFEEVARLTWSDTGAAHHEMAGSFMVHAGIWYVFNRASLRTSAADCRQDHARMVARASRDRGRTWSVPVTIVDPGASAHGDECAVLDGSTYHNPATSTWHLLAQCLGKDADGRPATWDLCHYTRKGSSPLGHFLPDVANPVVRGGDLWSRICTGLRTSCPATTRDEGTPEVLGKIGGRFFVSIHGYDPVSRHGFRGVVATRDWHDWQVRGKGLPGAPTLGPQDCAAWMNGCVGVGAAATLTYPGDPHRYMVVETMTENLACTAGQDWVFNLVRAPASAWPRSGTGDWTRLPGPVFLESRYRSPTSLCPIQYARWIRDGKDTYLVYEDWNRARDTVDRRLLRLMPGPRHPPTPGG